MGIETARGKLVTIHFDSARCIHSRHCVLDHPDVFVPNVPGEWIHPDAASVEEIVRVARTCPSGAITYVRHDGGGLEPAPLVSTVRIREDGPLAFNAPLTIGGAPTGFRATLCRCGASAAKPFCDGSHAKVGFRATGEPALQASEPLTERSGPLAIQPQKNGPLRVMGALEVVSGTGKTVNRVTEVWLCRCGQSQNKPYCDGSHRKGNFVAD